MMLRHLLIVAALAAFVQSSLAVKTFTSPEQLTATEYDFVVVGGGTAGLVVAARLSEHPNITVLVVEAGGDDRDYPDAEVPFLASELQHTGADWNYTTTPQAGYNNRSVSFERGHVLGGSSTVNYMAYNRASNDVYDRWANCPNLVAVEIAQPSTLKLVRVTARKEVILSAGAVGTPKVLMQSGIGPVSTLSSLNISTIVDLPSVGQNLTDHPLNPLYFTVNANTTVDPILQNPTVMEHALQTWNETHRGPLTNSASNTIAMLRLPQNATIFDTVPDPAAGPLSDNEELLFAEGFVPLADIPMPPTGNYISVLSIVTSPTSRGEVTVNSSDPFAPPVINPNYLTTEFDQYAAVQAMKDAFVVVGSKAFEGYIDAPYGPLADLSSDQQYLQYIRQHAVTINHGTGTAKMAPYGADWGVVDPDLKLKGASGLRVVDASIFPEIPECHTMAPVYIVAERAAAIIKEAHGFGT